MFADCCWGYQVLFSRYDCSSYSERRPVSSGVRHYFNSADMCTRRSTDSVTSELSSLLSRLHVLVVGPGLGREGYMQKYARIAIGIAKDKVSH